ncbi:hypothetical protein DFH07DRAFT_798996 [Mycena maculata]|uniref:Uncharacterized protein n=1 Tax=Mycena maculata TaxID=230809 RepID=A0AAD7K572_9AGAR|nr:hypothetical protein DFH07DRAFT_798996 [Mycena maculata]
MPPPPNKPFDLKSVARLFNDTIRVVREGPTPDFDPAAIEWLKAARHKLMRDIETHYYELEKALHNPSSQPAWIDPQKSLCLLTTMIPDVLEPYKFAFLANLVALVKDCGFNVCNSDAGPWIGLYIRFPTQVGEHPTAPAAVPQSLHVEDEFSWLAQGDGGRDRKPSVGAFTATNFGSLLAGVRGETETTPNTSLAKKRRRASGPVKEEPEEEGRRLRSMTRASSAETLRSHRGGRKRVKREE